MSTELGRNRVTQREHMLLSFERPASPGLLFVWGLGAEGVLSPDLENRIVGQHRSWVSPARPSSAQASFDHRQDRKGTRWMPWHQESMKDVDDCDKPR